MKWVFEVHNFIFKNLFFSYAAFSQQEKPHRWNANKNFIHFYTGWIKLPLWIFFLHIYALKIFLFSSCYINAMFFFYYFHSSFVCVWEQQLWRRWWKKKCWIFTIVGTVIGVAVTVVCRHHPCSSWCRLLALSLSISS